jgi:hypothetical protein
MFRSGAKSVQFDMGSLSFLIHAAKTSDCMLLVGRKRPPRHPKLLGDIQAQMNSTTLISDYGVFAAEVIGGILHRRRGAVHVSGS